MTHYRERTVNDVYDVVVVGAGIFGVTAALSLRRRQNTVALLDPGSLPNPRAASTDISKVVRMEYGADTVYMAMVEEALEGWHRWNEGWDEPLYHETGVVMLARAPLTPGGFEYESYQALLQRGHRPERLDADEIARRFPAWKPGAFVDGFFHARGGYAESGRVVAALIREAESRGVDVYERQVATALLRDGDRVTGVRTRSGETFAAGHVLVAAGSWTYLLVPELTPYMRATGHPVFHLRPADPKMFAPPRFTVFTADVSQTGWYGFPFHPGEGVVKIANHGVGVRLHPDDDERVVTAEDEARLRAFLSDTLPGLAEAPVVYTRRCLYADTLDEHLWIDRHPDLEGLTVATGGSGHGFKFAPILGDLIADVLEGARGGKENDWLVRFRWRELSAGTAGEEAARHHP
ncbi:MAG: FAD-dependent oxidoreductase [Candidatus Promineifilaceae bacterium]|nr:FAD-dependent oxidoreductase [Candidatus Promineifilaceae bacterium]